MIDFKLTKNGDIDMAAARQYPVLRLDFHSMPYACLRLDFDTDVLRYDTSPYGCKFDFYTNLRQLPDNAKTVLAVTDKEETSQEILIRLKTERGEFAALPNLGSKLVLNRHEDVRSSAVQEQVRQYAEEAIIDVDFENDPTVTVTRAEDDGTRFGHETLQITIDTGNITYFEGTI